MFKTENKANTLTGYKIGTHKQQPAIIQSILTINGMRVWNSLRSNMGKNPQTLGLRAKPFINSSMTEYNSKHAALVLGTMKTLLRPRGISGLGILLNPLESLLL